MNGDNSKDIRRSAIKAIVFMSLSEVAFLEELRHEDDDLDFKQYLYAAAQEVCLLPNIKEHPNQVEELLNWLGLHIPQCSPYLLDDLCLTLGKLLSVLSAETKVDRILLEMAKNDPQYDTFLLKASQSMFVHGEDMTPYEDFRKWIFGMASNPNHVIARYALCAISCLYYYHSDGLLLPHLKDPVFLRVLASHCEIRLDLIETFEVGLIEITKDNGSELRRYSLVILNNLLARKDFPMNSSTCGVFIGPISRLLKDEENNRLVAIRILNRFLKVEENKRLVRDNFADLWREVRGCFAEFNKDTVKSQIEEGGIKHMILKKLINMIAWAQYTMQNDEQAILLEDFVSILAAIKEDATMKKIWDNSKLAVFADPTRDGDDGGILVKQVSYIKH